MPKNGQNERNFFQNKIKQNQQRLYGEAVAAFFSVRTMVKAIQPPLSIVLSFRYSKTSDKRFTQTTSNSSKWKGFARFQNDICCVDLASIDKSRDNTNINSLFFWKKPVWQRVGYKRKEIKRLPKQQWEAFRKLLRQRIKRKKKVRLGYKTCWRLQKFLHHIYGTNILHNGLYKNWIYRE